MSLLIDVSYFGLCIFWYRHDHWSWCRFQQSRQKRHFNFFLGGPNFFLFFNATGLMKNWKKQHFIFSILTLFIVPFFLFSLFFSSFLSLFFLSFFFFFFFLFSLSLGGGGGGGDDGPSAPHQMTPLNHGFMNLAKMSYLIEIDDGNLENQSQPHVLYVCCISTSCIHEHTRYRCWNTEHFRCYRNRSSKASFGGLGAVAPPPPPPPQGKRKKRKKKEREKIKKREKRKKGIMNSVKLLHIKCCFFLIFQ